MTVDGGSGRDVGNNSREDDDGDDVMNIIDGQDSGCICHLCLS